MAGKAINQYNTFSGSASDVNVLVQETSQTDPNTYEHKKAKLDTIIATLKNIANGLAGLDGNGLIPESLLPAKYDDVVEGYYYNGVFYTTSTHTTVMTPTTGRIYIDLGGTGELYRYNGSAYITITDNALRSALTGGTVTVDKATKDASGNTITTTYATKSELNAEKSERKAVDSQHDARLQNLEQKAGDYSIVQYRGTNAVPTGKAKYGLVKEIVGKTRAWNQLVPNGNFASGDGWVLESGVTASFSGNVATISSTTSSNGIRREIDFINGHKYLVSAEINTESALAVKFGSSSSGGAQVQITTSVFNQFVKYSEIKTASADSYQFYIFVSGTYSNLKVRNVTLYDLTLIFGSGNEPSTVADALAQLPALGQYNAYDAGSLVSTEVSGVKSVGVNLFDEEVELGYINTSGEYKSSTTEIRSKNFISVLPATAYYIKNTNGFGLRFFDANENFVGVQQNVANSSFTTPANCTKLKFNFNIGYGTTYNNNVQICLNSYADKTTYHPYKTDTLSLPETVTLRSAGSVADELDVENGVVTHKIYKKTFSASDGWELSGAGNFFLEISDMYQVDYTTQISLLAEYAYDNTNSSIDKTYWNNGRFIFVRDTSFNGDASAFASALAGKKLNYALATPTTEFIDPIPDNTLYTEGGGTIDTIQEQSPVIDNCLDVGYLAV